jgi:hypothetical protein
MRPDDVRDWLNERPFKPFRISLTNGITFDVRVRHEVADVAVMHFSE